MASSPITSWQTEGEKVEVVIDFRSSLPMVTAAVNSEDYCFLVRKSRET